MSDIYTKIIRSKGKSAHLRVEDIHPIPLVLVGNKNDLVEERKVYNGQALSKRWNCPHYETSAKTSNKVNEVFYDVLRNLYELRRKM